MGLANLWRRLLGRPPDPDDAALAGLAVERQSAAKSKVYSVEYRFRLLFFSVDMPVRPQLV